jgi:hypothetical protein
MSHDPNATQHPTHVQAQQSSTSSNIPRAAGLGQDALSAAARVVQAHNARIAASMQARIIQ